MFLVSFYNLFNLNILLFFCVEGLCAWLVDLFFVVLGFFFDWFGFVLFCNSFSFSENIPVAMKIVWNTMLPDFGLNRCRQPGALLSICMGMKSLFLLFLTVIVRIWAVSGKVSAALLENGFRDIFSFFLSEMVPFSP